MRLSKFLPPIAATIASIAAADSGCAKPASSAAEASYTAELLQCVKNATTLKESKDCRAAVDKKYGIVRCEAGLCPLKP